MRIGILAHDLTGPEVRGLARYTAGLVRSLARDAAVEVVLFSRAPLAERYRDLPGERRAWPGRREVLWEQWDLPRRLARERIDVLHAPSNRGLCALAPCPTVLTRHDAIERLFPPDFPGTLRGRLRTRYSDAVSMARASAVVTVSETSRRDIVQSWRLAPDRVVVLGEGLDDRFFAGVADAEIARVRERLALPATYVLYLGGLDRRKEVPTLVDAFAALRWPGLACVIGGPTRGELAAVRERVSRHGLAGSVRVLGEVDEDDVPGLYAGAACFVYPSRYEGFGLQAAEAMSLGVPLVVSDGGALPEVAADAALTFPVGDSAALATCMATLLSDATLRLRLIERGRARAARFRWASVIPGYVSLYRTLAPRATIGAAPAPADRP